MKKLLVLGAALAAFPAAGFAASTIKMVTYFPVPYVAYSKINAQKQMDVGLTSACEMNLGCAESGALGTKPLQVTTANLNKGRLDLNAAAAVKSTNVTLGSGSGAADIDFEKNLRIATLSNGYSLEANDMTVDELKLFASHMKSGGEKFPSCAATGAAGAPQISWQKLKLKNAEEVYLLCGTPSASSGCDASSKPATPSPRTCNQCGTQSATVSCNYSTNQWQTTWGSCSVSNASQCATYSWKRDSSMDCVFNPGGGQWFCPMASSSSDSNGPLNVGNSCTGVLTPAAAMWGRGPINTTSSQKSGSCSSSEAGTLSYWHAVYSGTSVGAKYTYGCVAYVCAQD